MNWEIDSDGVKGEQQDGVLVGDPRTKVRDMLGRVRTVKGPYVPEIDQFVDQGLQVTYDDDSRAREIMVAVPEQARFLGVDLLDRPIDGVLADLSRRGVQTVRDADGAILPQAGISLFAVEDHVEAVTVGYPPRIQRLVRATLWRDHPVRRSEPNDKGIVAIGPYSYVFVDDLDDFALARAPREPDPGKRLRAGGWITDWAPIHFVLEQGFIVTDYLANSFAFRLCSEKLRAVIDSGRAESDQVQWLPTIVESREGQHLPFWVLHFPDPPNVVNLGRSVMSGSMLVKAYLDPDLVDGHRAFSLPHDSVSLIIDAAVKTAIQTAHCSGMKFSKVPLAQ